MMRIALYGGSIVTSRGLRPGTIIVSGNSIEAILSPNASIPPVDRTLDCSNMLVVPGFIDAHSHDDVAATDPTICEAKIRQGVTTVAIGMDGLGFAPLPHTWANELIQYWKPVNGSPGNLFGTSIEELRSRYTGKLILNVVMNVPHANLRIAQAGFSNRKLSREQLRKIAQYVQESLEQGAWGLTTGLSYVPAIFADFEELIKIMQPLQPATRPYITHLRDYGINIFEAVNEALNIGRVLGIPVHLSHLHLSHPQMFGRADALVELLDRAANEGLSITWDLYPYSAGSSVLHSYLPAWFTEGGPSAALARLKNASAIARLGNDPQFAQRDWSMVVIASTPSGRYVGCSIYDIAKDRRVTEAEAVAEILASEEFAVSCIVHQTDPSDDDILAVHPRAMIGSDGLPYGQQPHPRYYGAFPEFFHKYVYQQRALSLSEALNKMTGMTAKLYGLSPTRGQVTPGAVADLVVFDPLKYQSLATYENPRKFATGVRHVLVNGEIVLDNAVYLPEKRSGQVLTCA
ncbi:MAG: amidohydrolase family protein [Firmicutes bacterium]|nr:amidohydrolase family protein [Bacillota bacterium]